MGMIALLPFAFGFMAVGALLVGPPAYAHGRRAGRADLSLDADEARRILAGWAMPERTNLTPAPPPQAWAGPRALWHRAARLRIDRLFSGLWTQPIWLARTQLLQLQPASIPPVSAVWEPAKPWQTPGQLVPGEGDVVVEPEAAEPFICGTPVRAVLLAEAAPEPQPGQPDHPDYPWTVYPLEPGLGDHDEDERGRHSVADPLGDTAEWLDLVARLQAMGAVDVDPLALPCTHCTEDEHAGCVGCACPCKLAEVPSWASERAQEWPPVTR